MTEEELSSNMQFPSNSPEDSRSNSDLGRFGLGMKTASLFTNKKIYSFIKKRKVENKYHGLELGMLIFFKS